MYSVRDLFTSQRAVRSVARMVLPVMAIALLSLSALAQTYRATVTTSDISSAGRFTDTNLVNPWGLSHSPGGPWWVSDNNSGLSTLYDGTGAPQQLVVSIPAWNNPNGGGSPSGTVFNGTSDFQLTQGNPAFFLWDTEDGTISGWNPTVNPTTAVIAVNNWPDAVYKGLALASAGGANYLYAADFRGGKVAVFDKNFQPFSFGPNAFVDNTIPPGFAPFNIQLINNQLVVTYAKQNAAKHDDVSGAGNGYVRIFDTQGNLVMALQHVSQLNSPWGVALAPQNFGAFSGDLLIGNFGSGAIDAFDPKTGAFIAVMQDQSGLPLRLQGLWAIAFGNGSGSGPTTTLYFTAGVFEETHGLFGQIIPACSSIHCGSSNK